MEVPKKSVTVEGSAIYDLETLFSRLLVVYWLTTREDWLTIRKVTDWRLGKASDIQERLE